MWLQVPPAPKSRMHREQSAGVGPVHRILEDVAVEAGAVEVAGRVAVGEAVQDGQVDPAAVLVAAELVVVDQALVEEDVPGVGGCAGVGPVGVIDDGATVGIADAALDDGTGVVGEGDGVELGVGVEVGPGAVDVHGHVVVQVGGAAAVDKDPDGDGGGTGGLADLQDLPVGAVDEDEGAIGGRAGVGHDLADPPAEGIVVVLTDGGAVALAADAAEVVIDVVVVEPGAVVGDVAVLVVGDGDRGIAAGTVVVDGGVFVGLVVGAGLRDG